MKRLVVLFVCAACFLAGCSSVPMTGRRQLNLVSDQEVLTASLQQYDAYISKAPLSTDKAKTDMVVRVGQKVSSAVEQYMKNNGMSAELQNYKWEFKLVKDNTPNAFCMPGGKIVVYEGILPYTKDETGLAVVVGHEVAHAIAKHSNERMSQEIVASMGGQILDKYLSGKSQTMKTLGSAIYGLGAQYGVMLPYSRQHELEADKLGLIFMAMAGYDPNAAVTFWQRMSQSSDGQKPLEIMSTHPSDERRIAQAKAYLPEALKYYKR